MVAKKIALISATAAAIGPAASAIRSTIPDSQIWNLLDDRLLIDAQEAGRLTPELEDRMLGLIDLAAKGDADGVLLTCSLYSSVAAQANQGIPVLPPDLAAFEAALNAASRILVVASIPNALEDSRERLTELAARFPEAREIRGLLADAAFEPAQTGDVAALSATLREAIQDVSPAPEAIVLAQFSLAPAREILESQLDIPVFSGPQAAARELWTRIST